MVVRRFLEEVLAGEGRAALEDLISNQTLQQKSRAFRRSFGTVAITVNVLVATGEYAAVHFTARGTHSGTFQGVPPSGRAWTAGCSAVFRVERGRIADFWLTWDVLAILEQIGGLGRTAGASA